MKENNILSSLSYFSVFFAPLLFPIIIYFVAEKNVKYHAEKSLKTYLIPCVTAIIVLAISGVIGFSSINENPTGIATFIVAFMINLYYFIWNIVKDVKVFKEV
ncbi:DUF4870 domain-containing protein [Bacillus fungorum]|uniref:DUF4870 domain-containing protein n=1 Tax=Bacillus fungorum TaxID=2039284 RepID=UPI003391D31D